MARIKAHVVTFHDSVTTDIRHVAFDNRAEAVKHAAEAGIHNMRQFMEESEPVEGDAQALEDIEQAMVAEDYEEAFALYEGWREDADDYGALEMDTITVEESA